MRRWLAVVIGALMTVVLASSQPAVARQAKPAAVATPTAPWPSPAVIADRKREAERRTLFRSQEPVPITLTADFRAVQRDRDPKSTRTYPATISFQGAKGAVASMPITIRTRGHSRRNPVTCTFAPLRLEFDKKLTKDTIFDGHGPLKLGTHCRNGSEDIILRELAVYRMFNHLTPMSFRARAAKLTYIDTATSKVFADEMGLLIEDDDDVAKRMEGRVISLESAFFARVDQPTLNVLSLFQFMIGNTDYSITAQHNIELVQTQDLRRFTVPYDFDYSGLVDAPYAVPAKELPIEYVRDRLYRGPCRTEAEWQPYLQQMRTAKPAFIEILDTQSGLTDKYRKSAKNYIEEFYKLIDRPGNVKEMLIRPCLKIGA
jgi:hypothetical protein